MNLENQVQSTIWEKDQNFKKDPDPISRIWRAGIVLRQNDNFTGKFDVTPDGFIWLADGSTGTLFYVGCPKRILRSTTILKSPCMGG